MTLDAPVIELRDVRKVYDRSLRSATWRSGVPWLPQAPRDPHPALDGVDLRVPRGQALGLIGPNGAGKTTLLKVVAGVTQATSGRVDTRGRIASMIELGIGFHPELTGAENVRCSGVMHGKRVDELADVLPEIVDFAGIGDAIDAPVKTFSTGMKARLAFALATQFPCDILVVDEVLAVGDRDFQDKCFDRVVRLLESGVTLLLVSHAMDLIETVCGRAVQIRHGQLVDDGPTAEVIERYLTLSPSRYLPAADPSMRIVDYEVLPTFGPHDPQHVRAEVDVLRPVDHPVVGLDLSLPTVAPDHLIGSVMDPVPGLSRPGRYRLDGTSTPIGFENAHIRFALRLVDHVRVADVSETDCHLVGPEGHRPRLATVPTFRAERISHQRELVRRAAVVPDDVVLRTTGLVKRYPVRRHGAELRAMVPGRLGRSPHHEHLGLDDVSLVIGRGESVGIIGPNGAGKSTLLKAIAGLIDLDDGTIERHGRVVSVLDLAAGMHPELTGLENLVVNARILGMDRKALDREREAILAFAGIGDAIDAPVRQYSTGMRARLGMAVALRAPGDILLIDEILSVGDEQLRRAAMDEVAARCRRGATVLFVTHELQLVQQLCERVVRLDHGRVIDDGPTDEVVEAYGGSSWAGGVRDATAGIRLPSLALAQHHVPSGGTIRATGVVVVDQPSPTARLELAYRMSPEDRTIVVTREKREADSFNVHTLVTAGGILSEEGTFSYDLRVEGNDFTGRFDFVLSVIDDREEEVLAEAWEEVVLGKPGTNDAPTAVLKVDWTVTALDVGASA